MPVSQKSMKKPRQFSLSPIHVDVRQERLKEVEQRARRQLGMGGDMSVRPSDIRGSFAAAQKYRQRRRWLWSLPMLLSAFLILAALLALVFFSHKTD